MPTLTPRETKAIQAANASGKRPLLLIHGLWLLESSWHNWVSFFEAAGHPVVTVSWPGDPDSVAAARANPSAFVGQKVGMVADHASDVARALTLKPYVAGHSFGGLMAQIVAGRGLAYASAAIDPAPSRGVLPLPFSALKASFPVLGNPTNWTKAVSLTYPQYRYAFANAVSEAEARQLFETYPVAAPGAPLFQAASANINPWTEVQADKHHPERGPMLVTSGEKDNIVPHSMAYAAFKLQRKNVHHTEFHEFRDRGHSLVVDSGWKEVAEKSLEFFKRTP